jgi:hypothetical protein
VRYLSTTTQAITPSQNTVSWSTLDSNVQGDLGISFKNRIINGNMAIDQRNAGASVTANNATFAVDRFTSTMSQSSKFTAQQNAGSVTPPTGFANYLGYTSSSAYSVAASDYFLCSQNIEGFNTADLGWGTANAKTVTLSFQVYSSLTGTFGGTLNNSAFNRSYPFTYIISSANTWTTISITIAGDTSGTWIGATNGIGLRVNFGLGVGSTYNGTAGSWAGATYFSATGATSVVGTNGATFYITGVQLEVGTQATTFTTAGGSYGAEFALCQRYYQNIAYSQDEMIGVALAFATTQVETVINFAVEMRAAPSMGLSNFSNAYYLDGVNARNMNALSPYRTTTRNTLLYGTPASNVTAGVALRLQAAPSGSYGIVTASAEL